MDNTDKIKVICIGDSITEGFGLWETPSACYPAVLQTVLGFEYEVYNEGVTASCVSNHEIDGKVCGLPYIRQKKFQRALSLKGDIYVIMLGTNDAQDGFDEETEQCDPYCRLIELEPLFETYYQSLLDDIKKAAPKATLFLVTPIPIHYCVWRKHQEAYLQRLLPHIKQLAQNNHICFIDLHEEFMQIPNELLHHYYQPDGLHPNKDGAELIAHIIGYHVGNRCYEVL